MKLDSQHLYKALKSNTEILATELEELNYGRMFWKFDFIVDNQKVNNPLLKCEFEGLFVDLNLFKMESENGKYIYIPKYNPVIYNTQSKEFKEYKSPIEPQNNDFVRNYFFDNNLIILHERSVYKINLESGTITNTSFEFGSVILNDIYLSDGRFLLAFKNLKNYEDEEQEIKL
ncbi:hypothetical protein [Flavobacterium sp. 140616W15]|uniref:hypothetical protein n=1 Tax=Flavobacterium sp. 140616W15 TaxID=2478552 RepID=UPI000F0C5736|nr:hypothetical protein [Flavobacterium sp. 140616W15]AYN03299.1 hypothetical protein EAG11_03270 [Flavobacterium sp. 140616W15]